MAFKLRDLVARLRITVDKKSAGEAEKEVTAGFSKMAAAAAKFGAIIAGAFAVTKIIEFGRAAVRAAVEAEIPWNRLANTLENVDVKFAEVEHRIKLAAKALADTSTVGDEQFAETLDRLVSLSGDFEGSLKNVTLVADVAAKFFNGELAPAADLIGRAMSGNIRAFKQLGIDATSAGEALRIVAERSAGAAQNELQTLDGRLKQVGESWGNVKEGAGNAVIAFASFLAGSDDKLVTLNRYRLALDHIAKKLDEIGQTEKDKRAVLYADEIKGGIKGTTIGIPVLPGLTIDADESRAQAKAEADAIKAAAAARKTALAEEIAGLRRLFELGVLRTEDIARALELQKRLTKELSSTASAAGRAGLLAQLAELGGPATAGRPGAGAGPRPGLASIGGVKAGPRGVGVVGPGRDMDQRRKDEELAREQEFWWSVEDAAQGAAHGISDAFEEMFSTILEGEASVSESMKNFGKGIAASLIGGLKQYFKVEQAKEIAAGIGKLASGTWPPNPIALASAGKHFLSAAAWAAAAGLAGAAGGAISGGGGGGGGFSGGGARVANERSFEAQKGPQQIFYIQGFNPKDPVHVRILGQGMKAVAKVDSAVDVRPWDGA